MGSMHPVVAIDFFEKASIDDGVRLVRDKMTLKRAKLTTRLIAGDTASGVPDFAVGQ